MDRQLIAIYLSISLLVFGCLLAGFMFVAGFGCGILFAIFVFEPKEIADMKSTKGDGDR